MISSRPISDAGTKHHLEWLNPEDTSEHARLYDYGDLFREAADALKDVGLFEEALRFYMPLQQTNEYADVGFFMAMGECCSVLGKLEDAENCFLTVAEHDARHVESRVQLAKLYEGIGMSEEALKYVNEAVLLGRQESRSNRRRKDTRLEQLAVEFKTADAAREDAALRSIAPQPSSADLPTALTTTAPAAKDTEMNEEQRIANVQYLYGKLMQLLPQAKEGNAEATEDWLDIADALLREFRSNRVFYPIQRNITFLGYSREAQRKAGRHKGRNFIDEMQEMAGRLQESLGNGRPSVTLGHS